MEMRDLLEKMMKFAGEKTGQKPGDQWRGDDPNPPGKKLVGDSILKDLSKGKSPKSKEQELAEEFQAFLEAEFRDTVDKRPRRKSDRHPRGHKPQSGYKTVKTDEGVPYKATNPHPASKDPVVANVLKQMRPGLTGLEMNNEAFLYFAYELGKDRARGMWELYGPAIKYGYQSGIGVNEGWESGPEEYKEPYDDADDAYDRQRQEKIDTEAEREWAKLPKVSTYKLLGRGPNMEPNYEFDGKEYDTLEAAIEARKQLMADPKTPHPEHIGIQTLTRVQKESQIELQEINWKKTAASAATALALGANPLPADAAPFQSGLHKDSMTGGIKGKYSTVKSDNSRATLTIQHPGHQNMGVFITIPNEIIDFSTRGTDGRIKINGKVLPISLTGVGNYSSASIGLPPDFNDSKLINMILKTPGELLIEIPIYNQGARIFKFTIEPEKEKVSSPGSNTSKIPLEEMTNEAIDSDLVQSMGQDSFNRAGYNPLRDERHYLDTLSKLSNLYRQQGLDQTMKAEIFQRINDLNAEARKKGYIQAESRGHKIIANKLKDIERSKKFASGELNIPTPQERQAQLKKLEKAKPVKEYGADNISPYGQPATTPGVDPKQLAQGMQQFKAATGSTAPTTNLAKAIDTLSQGKLPTQQMVKDIQPAMKDLATITQNPNLASGAAKTAFQQANQARIKQQQLAKK